jgi:hypothetical protein
MNKLFLFFLMPIFFLHSILNFTMDKDGEVEVEAYQKLVLVPHDRLAVSFGQIQLPPHKKDVNKQKTANGSRIVPQDQKRAMLKLVGNGSSRTLTSPKNGSLRLKNGKTHAVNGVRPRNNTTGGGANPVVDSIVRCESLFPADEELESDIFDKNVNHNDVTEIRTCLEALCVYIAKQPSQDELLLEKNERCYIRQFLASKVKEAAIKEGNDKNVRWAENYTVELRSDEIETEKNFCIEVCSKHCELLKKSYQYAKKEENIFKRFIYYHYASTLCIAVDKEVHEMIDNTTYRLTNDEANDLANYFQDAKDFLFKINTIIHSSQNYNQFNDATQEAHKKHVEASLKMQELLTLKKSIAEINKQLSIKYTRAPNNKYKSKKHHMVQKKPKNYVSEENNTEDLATQRDINEYELESSQQDKIVGLNQQLIDINELYLKKLNETETLYLQSAEECLNALSVNPQINFIVLIKGILLNAEKIQKIKAKKFPTAELNSEKLKTLREKREAIKKEVQAIIINIKKIE